MDTAIIITGIIGLGAGLVLGGMLWGHYADTVKAQAEAIDALNLNNLRLRGQAAELATLAHDAQELARKSAGDANFYASKANEERLKVEKLDGMFRDCCDREVEALHQWEAESSQHRATKRKLAAAKGQITKLKRRMEDADRLDPDDVQWIVNDLAELGVLIKDQAFFLYKGRSLTYGASDYGGRKIMYRLVFKREFGECCHPINYSDPTKIGTVSLADSDDWKPLPVAVE